jgi:SAM-dependent methyltransferase
MPDRREVVLKHLNLGGLGLEIGPAYSPLVPKSEGYRVETVDHVDARDLREKYRELDVSRIEEVDYVTGGRSLFDAVGQPGRYDYIVASHLIEHVPDMLGLLKDCERLLKPDGRVSLVVPDKRYCFDVFQGLTTTGQVLQAHADRACRPNPGVVFDYYANFGKRGDEIAWRADDTMELQLPHSLATAKALFEKSCSTDEYTDAHVWRFVPSSFRLIVSDLHAIGEISMRELSFAAPGGFEFFVTFSCDAPGPGLDRLTLAKRALLELAAIALG